LLRLCLGAGDGGARGFAATKRRKGHESRRRRKGVEDMRSGEEVRRGKEMCAHHSLDATRRNDPRQAHTRANPDRTAPKLTQQGQHTQ
jgi:hypothetical protein